MDVFLDASESFRLFVKEFEPRLRHALVAAVGQQRGLDATADALAYGWEHWERVGQMDNPVGYLYRVGRSRSRMVRRLRPHFESAPESLPDVEPALPASLARLSEKQRIAVVMVHAYGWDREEVASLMGVTTSTLDTHLLRGLRKLRASLGVDR